MILEHSRLPKLLISLSITVWVMALFLIADHPLLAQQPISDSLAISGIVEGPTGPVAGAIVRVQNTSLKTTTAEDGAFTLTGLATERQVRVTAAAKGYYIRWADAIPGGEPVTIKLERHPVSDNNEVYEWQSAEGCGECHTAYQEWQADAHAQAATNIRFLTMYQGTDMHGNQSPPTVYNAAGALPPDLSQPYYGPGFKVDFPNRNGNCAACHTPMASNLDTGNSCGWSGCHTDVTTQNSNGVIPPSVSPLDLVGVAAEGISCDFCHKIGKVILDEETKTPAHDMPGILSISLYRPAEGEELFFGSVDDVAREADSYLSLQQESAFCAPCHYGAITTTVIYNSYGEWLASPYSNPETGQTCQDCHMPPVKAASAVFPEQSPVAPTRFFVFPYKGGLKRNPNQIHNHKMLGPEDETFLKNAVTMTTTAQVSGGDLHVEIKIRNDKAGHHVPTDIPLRHLILVVQAADAAGNPLPLLDGPTLPDWTGNYAGQPGRGYAKILEDTLTGEAPTMSHWRPVLIKEDTRIPALATDISRYTFAAPTDSPAIIETKLIYRRAFQQLMEWKGWDDPDIVMAEETIIIGGD
jgi:hypothetical protein